MKFKPGFSSHIPERNYLDRLGLEPFIAYSNPTENPTRPLEIPAATRFRHVYVAGASQHGKSTLLEHMITQDIENGEGVTLLDPKGDLAEAVLNRVPEHRVNQCIYIDIKDSIPINFMSWETEQERQTLLADVYQTFMRFSTMTSGDQWLSILRWTIYTLLASRCASFLDIYYFLTRKDTETRILDAVRSEDVNGRYEDIFHYWAKEYPKLKSPREGPIITRMSVFTTTPPLKTMLGTANAKFDVFRSMEDRKIVIVNLMGVGKDNGNLVGALLTSRIQQAAFRRQPQQKSVRVPHFFYADEFQNFQTSDFDSILAEAGGFRLSLTLANQGLYQLDNQIKQSVFTNVTAARIAFRLNHEDISNWKHLTPTDPEKQGYFEAQKLATLPPYFAFFKIGSEEGLVSGTPAPLPEPSPEQIDRAGRIRRNTIDEYRLPPDANAESSPKRTVDIPPSNSPPNIHTERNGTNDDRPEEIGPDTSV
jgi:hypothetical protein